MDVKKMTADAKSCIDLVKAGSYAEAIAPCERAMRDTAAVGADEVQGAFDQAKTAVAEEAQAAAVAAAAGALAGDDPSGAGAEAAGNLMKGLGK